MNDSIAILNYTCFQFFLIVAMVFYIVTAVLASREKHHLQHQSQVTVYNVPMQQTAPAVSK